MFNTIAHCTTFYYYAQVLRYIADLRPPANTNSVVNQFLDFRPKYFTMWGLGAQTLLFLLCVIHDSTRLLNKTNPVRRAARSVRDLFFVAVAAPWAVTVTALFWSVYLLDRELVMPAPLDAVIPAWLNHSMHSVVLVLAVAQLLAEPHYAPSMGATLGLTALVNIAYIYTLFNEYAVSGQWVYPLLSVLDWRGRMALLGFTFVLNLSQAALLRTAVRARWGDENINVMKKRKD